MDEEGGKKNNQLVVHKHIWRVCIHRNIMLPVAQAGACAAMPTTGARRQAVGPTSKAAGGRSPAFASSRRRSNAARARAL